MHGMRTLLLSSFIASAGLADPGQAGDAPQLSLEQAITKAKAYAATKKVDLSRQYLESVKFNPMGVGSDRTARCWSLVWQVPRAKGGTTFITLCEDGRSEHTFGE